MSRFAGRLARLEAAAGEQRRQRDAAWLATELGITTAEALAELDASAARLAHWRAADPTLRGDDPAAVARLAERLAAELGCDAADLLAEAERLAARELDE